MEVLLLLSMGRALLGMIITLATSPRLRCALQACTQSLPSNDLLTDDSGKSKMLTGRRTMLYPADTRGLPGVNKARLNSELMAIMPQLDAAAMR